MSKRAKFFDIISSIFDFQRNRTGASILLFVFAAASFGWLVNAAYSAIALLGTHALQCLLRLCLVDDLPLAWTRVATDALGPVLLFGLALLLMWLNYCRNRPHTPTLGLQPPRPHAGLVVGLSTYNPRGSSLATIADVSANLDSLEQARPELLKSNWGPLVIAVQHHAPVLRHCWLVTTQGERGSRRVSSTLRHPAWEFTDFLPLSLGRVQPAC